VTVNHIPGTVIAKLMSNKNSLKLEGIPSRISIGFEPGLGTSDGKKNINGI
jgi:hypothetical protein